MRTIKFRAWDKLSKTMIGPENWLGIQFSGQLIIADFRWNYTIAKNENFELMQFTGLTDNNGKEIYEGDIVRYSRLTSEKDEHNLIGKIEYEEDKYGIYEWIENRFKEKMFRECPDDLSMAVINNCCEVIGNIYDNPELLK